MITYFACTSNFYFDVQRDQTRDCDEESKLSKTHFWQTNFGKSIEQKIPLPFLIANELCIFWLNFHIQIGEGEMWEESLLSICLRIKTCDSVFCWWLLFLIRQNTLSIMSNAATSGISIYESKLNSWGDAYYFPLIGRNCPLKFELSYWKFCFSISNFSFIIYKDAWTFRVEGLLGFFAWSVFVGHGADIFWLFTSSGIVFAFFTRSCFYSLTDSHRLR